MSREKLIEKYDNQAGFYEKRQRKGSYDERWRRTLLKGISGEILEIAVGAGANFKFYSKSAKVTALDFSNEMLEKARLAAQQHRIEAEFRKTDMDEWEGEAAQFDYVVSTLSICGYDRPVNVIRAMAKSCKPEGKLLFMEHGLCKYKFARSVQKWIDPLNVKYAGCHINRDIEGIVRESGVKIEKLERRLFGVIYLIWAEP